MYFSLCPLTIYLDLWDMYCILRLRESVQDSLIGYVEKIC